MPDQREIDRRQQAWVEAGAVGTCLHVGCGTKPIEGTVNADPNPDRLRWCDVACDAHRLPFRDGAFDSAASSHVLEHLEDPVAALAEMARVLRRGGTMRHVVPDNRFTQHRESHRHPFATHRHEWRGPEEFRAVAEKAESAGLDCTLLESFPGFDWSFRVVFVKE